MRAAVFQEANAPLALLDLADPTPGPGQVVLRVERCGVCGTDLHLANSAPHLLCPGAVLGHEISGQIVALGEGVEPSRRDEPVAVLPFLGCRNCAACRHGRPNECRSAVALGSARQPGGYAEYLLADARNCVRLADGVSFEDGALVEPLAVALRGVNRARLMAADRVLVIGAGAIGLCVTHLLRKRGLRVAVAARSGRNERLARTIGAHAFIAIQDVLRTFAEEADDALGGAPTVVFECSGARGATDLAVSAVDTRGRVMMLGFCMEPEPINVMRATAKEVTILFSMVYAKSEFEAAALEIAASGNQLRALVDTTCGLADLPAKFEGLQSGRLRACKLQVAPQRA